MFNIVNILKYNKIKKSCKEHQNNHNFDMSDIDRQIGEFAESIYLKNKSKFIQFKNYKFFAAIAASTLYDTGGHSFCVRNLADSLYEDEKIPLFLSKLKQTQKKATKTMEILTGCCNILGVNYTSCNFTECLVNGFNQIVENCPKVMILYISQHDIYSTALMYLLKKYANIKMVFWNHASHFPNLAMNFADIILEGTSLTAKFTNENRHLYNCKIIGLQAKKKELVKYYSEEEIFAKKKELKIPNEVLMTVSGGSSYKYFEGEKSEHYEMIKRILVKMPNLYHLAITNFSNEQRAIIDDIFKDSPEALKRLKIHPLTPDYDILFQCADLFIDSFPIGSAMSQIDVMMMKIPTVAYENKTNAEYDFTGYMPQNYPYCYSNSYDMENGIIELLKDNNKREILSENNYKYVLDNFESIAFKNKIIKYIEEIL